MDRPETMTRDDLILGTAPDEATQYDRHDYLRPWRYFRFYMLYESNSRRTCWLPEGYHT